MENPLGRKSGSWKRWLAVVTCDLFLQDDRLSDDEEEGRDLIALAKNHLGLHGNNA